MAVSPVSQFIQGATSREVFAGAEPSVNPAVDQQENTPKVERVNEANATASTDNPTQRLTEEEAKQVAELQARDREVRAHEAAHRAVGGQYVRGGSLTYKIGPDGNQYAVAGEVSIDTSPVPGDPAATAQKAEQVRRAALAPANPSPQDQAVAAEAARLATEARAEAQQAHAEAAQKATKPSQNDKATAQDAAAETPAESRDSGPAELENPQPKEIAHYRHVASLHSDQQTEAALDMMA